MARIVEKSGKPLIIPVFIPHSGCPHQCAFCNQSIITNQKSKMPDAQSIMDSVNQYLQYRGSRKSVEIAFFGGNFLGLDIDLIRMLLDIAQSFILNGPVDGIRFSTRPETITAQTIDLISAYTINTIEIGVQSMNDDVLKASNRGHTSLDTVHAIERLRQLDLTLGVQVMIGLPSDSKSTLLESTRQLADLYPDVARIYPLLVLKGSPIAGLYKKGLYTPLSLNESIDLAGQMVNIFEQSKVEVIRLGLQASEMMDDADQVIAGPWHPAFGHLVFSKMLYDQTCSRIDHFLPLSGSKQFKMSCHSKTESRLRGNKNEYYNKLIKKYPMVNHSIQLDDNLSLNEVKLKIIG